jgi:hypothetical protein
MTVSDARRTVLWLAIEDFSGLWEVIWEFRALFPEADEAELKRRAVGDVSDLLLKGLIELYRCEEPYGKLEKISESEASTVLADMAAWREPEKDGISVRMGATSAGEEAYEAQALP